MTPILYSLREIARATGLKYYFLKTQVKGRRVGVKVKNDQLVTVAQFKHLPIPAELDLPDIKSKALYAANGAPLQAHVPTGPPKAVRVTVSVVPLNERMLFATDEFGLFHVMVKTNKVYNKGQELFVMPHALHKAFWFQVGPTPKQLGDSTYKLRLEHYAKGIS